MDSMKISAKTEYACRALLELCLTWPNPIPRQAVDIAIKQKIPTQFLTHILIALKGLGYVASTRGQAGGYYLVVHPRDIKLSQIMRQFGGLGLVPEEKQAKEYKGDAMSLIWSQVNDVVLKSLDEINFEDIALRSQQQMQTVSFEI
jgi:Rrf2 family protein